MIQRQEEIQRESHEETNYKEELDTPIDRQETEAAVRRLKQGKAAGNGEIVAEVLKKGGDNVCTCYVRNVWEQETLPKEWTRGVIFTIYKDGDNRDPNNYRDYSAKCSR